MQDTIPGNEKAWSQPSRGLEDVTDEIIFLMKRRHYTSVGLYECFCRIYSQAKPTAAGRFGKKNFSK
jgi:hypothetical protein